MNPVLVIGGTGKVGRRVVQRLTARGVPTRVGSRFGDPRFEWENLATWAPALRGMGAAYVAYSLELGVPRARNLLVSFAELAVRSGVRRLVLLGRRGEPESERAEEALRTTGAELTVLRSSWLNQSFSEDFLLQHVLSGVVELPDRNAREPFVDADDVADVAVAALTDARHAGRAYELTGQRLLTFRDAIAEIGEASGRDIRFEPVALEDYAARAAARGVPTVTADRIAYLIGEVLDGRNARLASGVQRALGRAPKDFRMYAREAAAAGIWDASRLAA